MYRESIPGEQGNPAAEQGSPASIPGVTGDLETTGGSSGHADEYREHTSPE
jgi:hypothetical protein